MRHKRQSGNPGSGEVEDHNKEDDGAQARQGARESKWQRHHQSTGASHPPHGGHMHIHKATHTKSICDLLICF